MAYFYEKIKTLTDKGLTVTTNYDECQGTTSSSGTIGTSPQTPKIVVKKADNTEVNLGYQITSDMLLGFLSQNFQFYKNVGIGNANRTSDDYGQTAGSDLTRFLKLQSIVFDRNYSIVESNPFSSLDSIMHFADTDYSDITLLYPAKIIREDLFNNSSTYARGISIGSDKNIKLSGDLSSVNVEHGSFLQLGTKWQAKSSDCIQIYSTLSQANFDATNLQNNPIAIFTYISNNPYGFGIAGTTTSNAKMQANIPIHAPYFNTTSDIRAKKDISKTTFAARDVVKALPIYSYILKENNERNIGIIAQDALNVNLDGFELVKNKEATGKDGDYMAIKESKLVYVAWKAIQEQEEIIEKQQQEIDELKGLVRQLLETKK